MKSVSSFTGITMGKTLVTAVQQPPLIPDNIQFFTLMQAGELLNYEFKNLDASLIEEGCKIIDAPYLGGGTFWVKIDNDIAIEEETLKIRISGEIQRGVKAIVIYYKLDKNHPRY